MTESRLTRVSAEVVTQQAISRLTAVRPEIANSGSKSRLSAVRPEVVWSANPRSRLTAARIEVARSYAAPLPGVANSKQVWPRGGGTLPGTGTPMLVGAAAGGDLGGTYPNPDVLKLKGLPMVGTLGANQSWAKDPAAAQLIPYSAGTPSVAYQVWDPFVKDVTPHALTEEFDTSSLAAFTQLYTGDAGVLFDADTTARGWLWLELPVQNYRMRTFLKALPGDTNWTIHTVVALGYQGGDGSYPGIVLSDSATAGAGSQTCCVYSYVNSYGQRGILNWAGFGNTVAGAALPYGIGGSGGYCFLRIRKQAGTYYFGWCLEPTGQVWKEVNSGLYAGITPTHFGLEAQNYTGGVARVGFGYLRYYATGTQYTTGGMRNVYV